MDNLISVILPVYNGGEYLDTSIQSILNQTHENLEVIIINDASKDESCSIIEKYKELDSRIIFVNHEKNKGLIASLNEGISLARGPFIARMDQDDISDLSRLELQYNYMLGNDDDICGGNFTTIDEKGIVLSLNEVPKSRHSILLEMASNVPFAHSSVMIRKAFLEQHNLTYGMNGDKSAEDLDLWLKMYNNGAKFGNIDENILQYRILSTSMSRINHNKMKKEKDIQLNRFMKENKKNFENAFCELLKQKEIAPERHKSLVRASLRYAYLYSNCTICFKCFKKVELISFIKGTLSFLKLKINI